MKWMLSFGGLSGFTRPLFLRAKWPVPRMRLPERAPSAADASLGGATAPRLDTPGADARLTLGAALEMAVFGALLPAALVWFSPAQSLPLVLALLALSPLLLGLHYGFWAGTGSAALTWGTLAALTVFRPELLAQFPKAQGIALLLIGMCAGQARDRWTGQVQRLRYLRHYHQTRLQQFTGAYQLLQVSHAQLERRLAGSANSLRSALQRLKLRQPVWDGTQKEPLGGIGSWLLDIMVDAGRLHAAAVYALNERGGLQLPAVATVGTGTGLSLFNPLLRETLRTGTLTSVQAGNDAVHERVIAVVPLIDASGHVYGVVSINDMPFLNVHQDTFELLGLLGRHIGDILARRLHTAHAAQGNGGLHQRLARNLADLKRHGLPAALIACKVVDAPSPDASVTHCASGSRGLDQSWVCFDRKGQPVVLTLLPLTDEAGVKSYLARLDSADAGGHSLMRGVATRQWLLCENRSAADLLAEVSAACGIEALNVAAAEPDPLHTSPPKVAL